MAKEAKWETSKAGWFDWMTKAKNLRETIPQVSMTIEIDENLNPVVLFKGSEEAIKDLDKSLRAQGVSVPKHLPRVMSFSGMEQIEDLDKATKNLNVTAKKMNWPALAKRDLNTKEYSDDDHKPLDMMDFRALDNAGNPSFGNMLRHIKLAIRDKLKERHGVEGDDVQEPIELNESHNAPYIAPATAEESHEHNTQFVFDAEFTVDRENSPVGSVRLNFDVDAEPEQKKEDLREIPAAFGAEGKDRVKRDGNGIIIKGITPEELAGDAPTIGRADVLERIGAILNPPAPAVEEQAGFVPETDYTIDRTRSDANQVVLRISDGANHGEELNDVRAMFGDEGEARVEPYRSRKDTSNRGVIIQGITAEELLQPGEETIGKSVLAERIGAILNPTPAQEVDDGVHLELAPEFTINRERSPAGGVRLNFPLDATDEQIADALREFRAPFGEEGEKSVRARKDTREGMPASILIQGITPDELAGPEATTIEQAAVTERISAILSQRAEKPVELTLENQQPAAGQKRVAFRFDPGVTAERKQRYLEEVRAAYGENGDKNVRLYGADKADPVGIAITGMDKTEVLQEGQTKIGNKALVEKVGIVNAPVAELIPVPELAQEQPKQTSAEVVAEFMKAMRAKMVQERQQPNQLAGQKPANITFPEGDEMVVFSGLPAGTDTVAVVNALRAEGFPSTLQQGKDAKEIRIDLSGDPEATYATPGTTNAETSAEMQERLEAALSTGFGEKTVEQLMKRYRNNNPSVEQGAAIG